MVDLLKNRIKEQQIFGQTELKNNKLLDKQTKETNRRTDKSACIVISIYYFPCHSGVKIGGQYKIEYRKRAIITLSRYKPRSFL
jgi:hypothetical protein